MIEVKNLSKQYGKIWALRDVGFSLPHHEIVFIVGPNGAGKSTLFRILTGYIQPSSGEILFRGQPISDSQRFLSDVGYVPESCPLYSEMNVYEFIKLTADMHGLSQAEFDKNFLPILDKLQLPISL